MMTYGQLYVAITILGVLLIWVPMIKIIFKDKKNERK